MKRIVNARRQLLNQWQVLPIVIPFRVQGINKRMRKLVSVNAAIWLHTVQEIRNLQCFVIVLVRRLQFAQYRKNLIHCRAHVNVQQLLNAKRRKYLIMTYVAVYYLPPRQIRQPIFHQIFRLQRRQIIQQIFQQGCRQNYRRIFHPNFPQPRNQITQQHRHQLTRQGRHQSIQQLIHRCIRLLFHPEIRHRARPTIQHSAHQIIRQWLPQVTHHLFHHKVQSPVNIKHWAHQILHRMSEYLTDIWFCNWEETMIYCKYICKTSRYPEVNGDTLWFKNWHIRKIQYYKTNWQSLSMMFGEEASWLNIASELLKER